MLYRDAVPALVHRFKFRGDLAAGLALASLLADKAREAPVPDCVVPVPSSVARRRQRGFDPGLEIGRCVARALGLDLQRRAASRPVHRPPQSSLPDWSSRWANVQGVFHVEPRRVEGRSLALVDDVMTSGATLTALAGALRAAGARKVQVWVACRAMPPGGRPGRSAARNSGPPAPPRGAGDC